MGIIAINVNTTGLIGDQVQPRRCTLVTTDNLAAVTAAGYLNNENKLGNTILPTDIFDVLYSFNTSTGQGTFGMFTVNYSSSTGFSLVQWANPGDVLLPVVSGDFAVFNGTTGQIKDAGYSATNAAKTKVVMLNAAPTINHIAIFTAADGTIGDGGVLGTAAAKAASNNALSTLASTAGSGFTSGHIVTASDAAGSLQDSGVLASAVQLSANIKANRTANIGGGGAGPIAVAVAGLTAASIVTASIQTSSNPVDIQEVTATSTGFSILFSGDPGATCTVNYVAFVVAQ
jgi:hypothetical protein